MSPLFSIILTTYNRSQFLPRAINSVLQQTFTDFELIIVDDHSTDNTQHVVTEFNDKRITYIRLDHNQGVSTARNTGITQAKGEYLCFLDDDDEYLPEFLYEVHCFLEKRKQPFIGFIRVGITRVFAPGKRDNKEKTIEIQIWHWPQEKNVLLSTEIHCVGLIYHNICFQRAGVFNPKLSYLEDIDMLLRSVEAGGSYVSIPKVLIKVHIHDQSSLSRTMNLSHRIANLENFIFLQNKFLNQHFPFWLHSYHSLAGDYYRIGEKHLARKLVFRIIRKCWYYPKIWELFFRFEFKSLKSNLLKS
jgi:GT2 family glycosyltransferase